MSQLSGQESASPESASPGAILERQLRDIADRNFAPAVARFAEDTVVEHPFFTPEPVTFRGREALRRHFAGAPELPLTLRVSDLVVYQTTDPEVLVAEFNYQATNTTTGRTRVLPNIVVVRVRDGLIVSSRDYHLHQAIRDLLQDGVEAVPAG